MSDSNARLPLELPVLAGFVFMGIGGLMLVGGLLLAFDEPGGFALAFMGLVFMGAGYMARKLFAAPPGKKAVSVSSMSAGITTRHGARGTRSQASIIDVDENASDAEVEERRLAWMQEQLEARPDWIEGRVKGDDERSGTLPYWAAGLWIAFAAGMSAAAFFWDSALWPFAGLAALMALGFVINAVRVAWRRRKFGASHFCLEEVPVWLGGRVTGEVETGIDQRMRPQGPFEMVLRCVHRWEEKDHEDRTHLRRDVLWEDSRRATGSAWGSAPLRHAVAVDFGVPADRPATTLGGGNEGIRWELEVRAPLTGIDYVARFDLPVLDPEELGGS